jgi:hypothetical protein
MLYFKNVDVVRRDVHNNVNVTAGKLATSNRLYFRIDQARPRQQPWLVLLDIGLA